MKTSLFTQPEVSNDDIYFYIVTYLLYIFYWFIYLYWVQMILFPWNYLPINPGLSRSQSQSRAFTRLLCSVWHDIPKQKGFRNVDYFQMYFITQHLNKTTLSWQLPKLTGYLSVVIWGTIHLELLVCHKSVKSRSPRNMPRRSRWREEVQLYSSCNLGARWCGCSKSSPDRLTPAGRDQVPVVQEVWWTPQPVWTSAVNLDRTRIRSLERPARSETLYRVSYPGPHESSVVNVFSVTL